MPRKIDHIVYAVPDLEDAMDDFEQRLGVRPVFGGYHRSQGTKNALVNLNDGCYLELLAADPDNTAVQPPRWMGIDVLSEPQITRWALKSTDLGNDRLILQAQQAEMGEIRGGSRHTEDGDLLKWEMVLPLSVPEVEIIPFMVDWTDTDIHPTDALPAMGCKLLALSAAHPTPHVFKDTLQRLGYPLRIETAAHVSIKAKLSTPRGLVEI